VFVDLVVLHGHGSHPRVLDLSGLAGSGGGAGEAGLVHSAGAQVATVIEPRGSVAVDGDPTHAKGSAWWPDGELTVAAWNGLCQQLDRAVSEAGTRWHDRLLVAGFSQGAAAALAWLAHPERTTRIDVAVLVAAFVPDGLDPHLPEVLPAEMRPGTTTVVALQPEDDEVVDPFHGARAARRLRTLGFSVLAREIAGGHAWPTELSAVLRTFLGDGDFASVQAALRPAPPS
jgi:predicted esterase